MLLLLVTVSILFLGSFADEYEVCYGKDFSFPPEVTPPLYKGPLILMPSRGGPTRTVMENGMAIEPRIKISHASATLTDLTERDEGTYSIGQNTIFTLKVLDCAEEVETHYGEIWKLSLPENTLLSRTLLSVKEHVRHYTKHVDEYLIIEYTWDNGTWLVNFQPEGRNDNITLIKDGVKQLEDWFDWRLEIQSAGIKIDALEIKDSGTFEFRDKKGDLVLVAHLEVKDKKDDDPPPPPLLLVYISVAFLLGGLLCCWFTRNMKCWKKCWKKCCRRDKSTPQTAAPPAAHYHSESQSVVPSYSAVPSSTAQPETPQQNPTADPHV